MSAESRLANPRRTTLATLLGTASAVRTCEGVDGSMCHNPATRVVETAEGSRLQCRSCSDR